MARNKTLAPEYTMWRYMGEELSNNLVDFMTELGNGLTWEQIQAKKHLLNEYINGQI